MLVTESDEVKEKQLIDTVLCTKQVPATANIAKLRYAQKTVSHCTVFPNILQR